VSKNMRRRTTKMRLKSIAVLVVAMLLVAGSAGGIAAAGAEGRGSGGEFRQEQGWRFDACYWWEVPPVTPYEREQIKEIMTLVIRRYFGIDVSAMSPREFEEVGESLGPAKEWEALRLFGYYARKRGFEVPAGVFDAPPGFDEPPGIPARIETPPEEPRAYITAGEVYWWEVVANPDEEVKKIMQDIAEVKGMSPDEVEERFGELFPGVDLWEMSLAEFCYFVGKLSRPPFRALCLEQEKLEPHVIAVFGRVPELLTERQIKEFDEKLRRVIDAVPSSVWDSILSSSPPCFSRGTAIPVVAIGANRGAINI
jgi:hypothetical protein